MEIENIEYVGKLKHWQISVIKDMLEKINEDSPCHINAQIRLQLNQALDEFIEAESIENPSLENKFVETIKLQH